MKKTLKTTLLLCLTLTLLLSLVACFGTKDKENETTPTTVTTPQSTTPAATTPAVTTPAEEPDPDKPEGATLVGAVNGKNAKELIEAFETAFTTAESCDWYAEMTMTVDDFSMTQTISMKLFDGEFALAIGTDGEVMEIYFVDDVLYMNSFGEKMQIPADSIDEILGEGALESFLYMAEGFEVSDAELAAATDAKIYLLDDKYIVTLHYVNEETDLEETSKYYFNAAGKMTQAESFSDDGYALITVNSYGEPVEVTPPADADEYIPVEGGEGNDTPIILPEDEDAIYAIYNDVCTTLQECEYMSVYISILETYFVTYEVAGEDKHISLIDEESTVDQYLIDNVGYVSIDYSESLEVPVDDDFLESFAAIESLFPINAIAKKELQNLRCSYDADWEEIVIKFNYSDENNTTLQYKYALAADGSYVDVTVTELIDGVEEGTYSYYFEEDPDLEIQMHVGK